MTIYADGRIPYFYVIQSKDTGKKYAGAKWGKDANPDLFMNRGGYKTSSNTVKKILGESDGAIFSVLEIITEEELQIPFGCMSVQDYEQWYLESNDCCKSMDWLNKSYASCYGTTEFYNNMIGKYGVAHATQVDSIKETIKGVNLLRYGFPYAMQNSQVSKKGIATKIAKYGYASTFQVQGYSENMVKMMYGNEYSHISQVPEIKAKK